MTENFPTLLEYADVFFRMNYNTKYEQFSWHSEIAEKLTNIFLKKNEKNLIICMPPRFGKSELGIKIWITYCLAFIPDCNFIIASSTLDLARSHVSSMRNTIKTEWFKKCFPFGASFKNETAIKSTARSDFFETIQGGSVKAVGLGGQITGFGAGRKRESENAGIFGGAIVCDDLLKEQDYLSQTQRDITYSWFKSTICSRRNTADTPLILIMQRLHDDDIVGRLLKEEPEEWDVLTVQAFDYSRNCSMWESAISTQSLLKMKDSQAPIDEYMFYAKYQQKPRTDLSSIIKPSWWQYYDRKDIGKLNITHRIITSDTAYKANDYNDESVLQLWGFSSDKAYLLDMIHGRWEFPELLLKSRNFYKKHSTFLNNRKMGQLFIEDKASGTSLVQTLRNEGIDARLWNPDPRDKISRVLESTRYIANEMVYLPVGEKISQELVDQAAAFTGDDRVHDDLVDAMTMAMLIWRMTSSRAKKRSIK